MLKSLFINNIILIDRLEINFDKGLIVFSGETGAGKSIMINSLSLALGRRADINYVGSFSEEASVISTFEVEKNHPANLKIAENGIACNSDIILRRVLNKNGNNKAFINDIPVTVSFLKEVGSFLVDIHGQNEKIGLLDNALHIKILDKFGNYQSSLLDMKTKYEKYKKLKEIYEELLLVESSKIYEEENIKNQIEQINNLNMKENEEEELQKKRIFLSQYEKIFQAINEIYSVLNDNEFSILDKLASNLIKLEEIASKSKNLKEIDNINKSINTILVEGKETIANIDRIKEEITFDSKELEFAEHRLFDINNLSRKFKVLPSELLEVRERLVEELSLLNNNNENIKKIKSKMDAALLQYKEVCEELTSLRKNAALTLEDLVNKELNPLKLMDANFRVGILNKEEKNWNALGKDSIKFLVKLNKGSDEGEIHRISSGGELSRLMLALNLVITDNKSSKTLVFDEVDSGVSGSVADSIGKRLSKLGKLQQILVITHLPQIAARGNDHYKSFKKSVNEKTVTKIEKLNHEKRKQEIAQMISGEKLSKEALEVASNLLEMEE